MANGQPMPQEQQGQEQQPQEQQGGSKVAQLFDSVNKGLSMVTELVQKMGLPEQVVSEMQSVTDHYQSTIKMIMEGGQAQGGQPGMQPMEQGKQKVERMMG
jgi:hypothetical protein